MNDENVLGKPTQRQKRTHTLPIYLRLPKEKNERVNFKRERERERVYATT